MVNFLAKHRLVSIIIILIALIGIAAAIVLSSPLAAKVGDDWTKIELDVKLLRLNTEIQIHKDGSQLGVVKGNILRLITDPLVYYDTNGNKIAYADDSYHFIAQDSHSITVGDKVTAEMVGKFKLLGEEYSIYNDNGNLMANAEFDFLNLNGKITDINGNVIAVYRSTPVLKDFTIYISPNCKIDESTIIMICCSYYSDKSYDERNSNNSSD